MDTDRTLAEATEAWEKARLEYIAADAQLYLPHGRDCPVVRAHIARAKSELHAAWQHADSLGIRARGM